jgi:peptidoglycan/xylan/chitin deacetylase (PgdA/CDA1 family)
VTPVDDSIDDGPLWDRSQQPPRTDAEERRRRFIRRRATALGALLLLIIWIATLASGGSGHPRKPTAHRAVGPVAATPVAPTSAAVTAHQAAAIKSTLGYTAFLSQGSANRREIALTFDDGPGPFTPQILDILERKHVPATFFVVGRSLKDFGQTLPREIADGFAIGDHTQDHMVMTNLSPKDQEAQLIQQATAIRSYGAPFPHLFRPPYGGFDKTTLGYTHKFGMLTVLWTVDTKDFAQPGVGAIVHSVLAGAKPGAIILMHDAGGQRAQTVAALPTIIAALRRRHFELVTVPKLVDDDPPLEAQTTPPHLSGG